MIYELRILSGLHRGATLPLDDQPLVIGASEDADVVLADAGIATRHATLILTEAGWALSALDGGICSADSNEREALIDLVPGDFARVGDIWVTVVTQDASWENPPAAPDEIEFDASESDEAAPADAGAEAETESVVAARGGEAAAAPAASAEPPDAVPQRRNRRMMYMPLVAATVLSAAAAYAITSPSSAPTATGRVDIRRDVAAKSLQQPGLIESRLLTREELRAAFRKQLADADLLRRFDLSLEDDAWFMQAALDDDEAARFGRILTKFMKTYNVTFPVEAKVGSAESMLPFKIGQIISGSNASVVTQDGMRLYVGDHYRGVRLVAVRGNHLTFAGKRKIEVVW